MRNFIGNRVTRSKSRLTLALPTYIQNSKTLLTALSQLSNSSPLLHCSRTTYGPYGEEMLFQLICNRDTTPAYAALSALGAGLEVENNFWLRIDPIELLVDAGNVCLVGRDHLELQVAEAEALLACINNLLLEDKLQIQRGAPHEWFLSLASHPNINTVPLCNVIAKDIRNFLPDGSDEKWWNRLITELQMLLFQNEINSVRQQHNKPSVNGVWLWGEGTIPSKLTLNDYHHIWSDHSLVKGITQLASKEQFISPPAQFKLDQLGRDGNYLVVIDIQPSNFMEVLAIINEILTALHEKKLKQFSLYLGNGETYTWPTPRTKLLSFFKKKLWKI